MILALLALPLLACAARDPGDAGVTPDRLDDVLDGAAFDAELEASVDSDAEVPDAAVVGPGACELRVVTQPRLECRDACDARLLLVSGAYYCSFQCTSTEECAAHGAALDCVAEIGGACVPRCERDEDCPAGFYRCDPAGRFCDTYPVDG